MLTNKELYGISDVPLIPKEVANKRIDLLDEHLAELMSCHFMNRDNHIINEILKAKEFWSRLRDGEEGI